MKKASCPEHLFSHTDSSTSSSTRSLSTRAIRDIVETLKHQRHRDTTRANYYCVWKLFNQFFLHLDVRPSTWEDRLTLFVGYLIETNKRSSTVKSYISTIKSVVTEFGSDIQENGFLISSLTRACKLQNDRVHLKLPIKRDLLEAMILQLPKLFSSQPYLEILYKAMFTTAYFGLFRISEIALTLSKHAVLTPDVHIGKNKDKLMFILHTSKTHGRGTFPQIVKISSEQKINKVPIYCPFNTIKDYIKMRKAIKKPTEHFFVFRD